MAHLNSCSSAPLTTTFTLESDDISTLLYSLLHGSSLPSSTTSSAPATSSTPLPEIPEPRRYFAGSRAFPDSDAAAGRGCYAPAENERSGSVFSGAIDSSTDFGYDSERDREVLRNSTPAPSRSSSKRNRAADVHNLSEKRRRQRINEKMKALQKLIPNSNKTDKASMLDEAIEYLKQLQLRVQMLAMKNGSSLHPFYLPPIMDTAQPILGGTSFSNADGVPGSTIEGVSTISAEKELPLSNAYVQLNQCAQADQKIYMSQPVAGSSKEGSFYVESSTAAPCRPFMFNMPSKDQCADPEFPQLQLDMRRYGDESSSGISS